MSDGDFTVEERQLLEQYQKFPLNLASKANRIAVEVIPPVIFVLLGILRDRSLYFIAVICLLVSFNVLRTLRQSRMIQLLKSISIKTIGSTKDGQDSRADG